MTNIDDYLKEISKYCSIDSVLVIDKYGELRRIYCPFKVLCIKDIDRFKKGDILIVSAVKMSKNLFLVYIISNRGYYYYSFTIL